jgi:hypothetical protein
MNGGTGGHVGYCDKYCTLFIVYLTTLALSQAA